MELSCDVSAKEASAFVIPSMRIQSPIKDSGIMEIKGSNNLI